METVVADTIDTIDVDYVRRGLAASHLVVRDGRAAFIDTGHPAAVALLHAALNERGLRRSQVDYVMVTHVHLDHAGAAGGLMRTLPNAKLVVHPLGARHMHDPARLMTGARAVYGDVEYERLYGNVVAIPKEWMIEVNDGDRLPLGESELLAIHTPGHACHHYCIYDAGTRSVFTGDTFGMSFREFDTNNGAFAFPTTTPVQLDPPALHASIDRLLSLDPEAAYLTHFGRVTDLRRLAADLHRDLERFVEIAQRHSNTGADRKNAPIPHS